MAIERQIANEIARAHVQSQYSESEAANRIGVSRAALNGWRCGDYTPTIENARAIERVYSLEAGSISDLVRKMPSRCGHNNQRKGAR